MDVTDGTQCEVEELFSRFNDKPRYAPGRRTDSVRTICGRAYTHVTLWQESVGAAGAGQGARRRFMERRAIEPCKFAHVMEPVGPGARRHRDGVGPFHELCAGRPKLLEAQIAMQAHAANVRHRRAQGSDRHAAIARRGRRCRSPRRHERRHSRRSCERGGNSSCWRAGPPIPASCCGGTKLPRNSKDLAGREAGAGPPVRVRSDVLQIQYSCSCGMLFVVRQRRTSWCAPCGDPRAIGRRGASGRNGKKV
jgi:hypothetical protein